MNAPFTLTQGSPLLFVLGYAALWAILIAIVEAGQPDFAAALAILIAGGAGAALLLRVTQNFREVPRGSP